jgi:hypothetical protein
VFLHSRPSKFRITGAACFLAVLLSGCETDVDVAKLNPFGGKKSEIPACPKVRMLKDADKLTQYRPGPGRDITDIMFEADLVGFNGDCEYIGEEGKYTSVVVTLKVGFKVARGPSVSGDSAKVPYFLAIPEFFPDANAKQSFVRDVKFPKNRTSVTIIDSEVEVSIPLDTSRKGPDTQVIIGFSLSPEQLEFNRRRGRATILGE